MLKAERRLLRLGLHNPPSGTGLGKALEKALGAPAGSWLNASHGGQEGHRQPGWCQT